jgi:hypothetical protein
MTDDETKHQTWMLLATDPCCELRLLSLNKTAYKRRSPREVDPEKIIKKGLEQLENRVLQELQHQIQKLERQVEDLEHQLKELPPAEKHLAEQHLIEERQRRLTELEHQQQELSRQRQAGKLQQPLEEQERLSMLTSAEIPAYLFIKACTIVQKDPAYVRFLEVAENPVGRYLDALANALVACAILLAEEQGAKQTREDIDEDLRDKLTEQIRTTLGPKEKGVVDPIVKTLGWIGSAAFGVGSYVTSFMFATPITKRRRGQVTGTASPIAGDILLYQCRGCDIRRWIHDHLMRLSPPIVVLAHSLGGVASVDLLMKLNLRDRVPLLVTVGSQAPYLYEINALRSLKYHEQVKLPDHFPPWLNLYNHRDFLSYVGQPVFGDIVIDKEVTSLQPFPQSHSAYWNQPITYDFIRKAIQDHVK